MKNTTWSVRTAVSERQFESAEGWVRTADGDGVAFSHTARYGEEVTVFFPWTAVISLTTRRPL